MSHFFVNSNSPLELPLILSESEESLMIPSFSENNKIEHVTRVTTILVNEVANPNKKKRVRKRKVDSMVLEYNFLYIPRIVKHDVRRQYLVMLSNVYNSADYHFMMEYLRTFTRNDLELRIEVHDHGEVRDKVSIGVDGCGSEWYERMIDAPDLQFTLTDVKFKLRSDGTSCVIGKFEAKGTKFLTPIIQESSISNLSSEIDDELTENDQLEDLLSDSDFNQAFNEYLTDCDISHTPSKFIEYPSKMNAVKKLDIIQVPTRPLYYKGEVIQHIDTDLRICKTHFRITL